MQCHWTVNLLNLQITKMTSEQIKKDCEMVRGMIKICQDRLEDLQSKCKHENTFEGNYSWRIGSIDPAIICSDCGKLIEIKNTFVSPYNI